MVQCCVNKVALRYSCSPKILAVTGTHHYIFTKLLVYCSQASRAGISISWFNYGRVGEGLLQFLRGFIANSG